MLLRFSFQAFYIKFNIVSFTEELKKAAAVPFSTFIKAFFYPTQHRFRSVDILKINTGVLTNGFVHAK